MSTDIATDPNETEHEGADPDVSRAPLNMLSPLDQSMRRGNPRQRQSPPNLWDAPGAVNAPSLSMAPENITGADEYSETDAGYVASAVDALAALHEGAKKVIEARESLKTDPTMTDAAKVIAVSDLQTKFMTPATRKVDAARASLDKAIAETELSLRSPITSGASGALAQEVRAYVRSLKPAERQTLLMTAINEGDATTVGAVLGCPVAYLAGITKDMQAALTQQWHVKRSPEVARRLGLMKLAVSKLEAAGSAYTGSMEQLAGVRHATVARLKAQRDGARAVIGAVVPD